MAPIPDQDVCDETNLVHRLAAQSLRGLKHLVPLLVVAAATIGISASAHARKAAVPPEHAAPCGSAIAPGALLEPPNVDVASLPLDDLGRHELIMRVLHDGDRFCFHYSLNGTEHHVAPVIRTHRGERFALRLVNEIGGSAPGALMKAGELTPCMPMPMQPPQIQHFSGYLNHVIDASQMAMAPLDVNLHLHGFQGPPEQENVFLSTLSTASHACEYDVTIPRTQPPGTYFYHPHAHGVSGSEVAGGLFGMWIVEPDTPQIARTDEHEVILGHRLPAMDDNSAAAKEGTLDLASVSPIIAERERSLRLVPPLTSYDPFNPPLWPDTFAYGIGSRRFIDAANDCDHNANQRMLAVDGMDAPARLTVPAGRTQLFRILDGTAMQLRYLRLRDAAGNVQMLHVVARDGIPVGGDDAHPLARYVPMSGVLLGPGSRADVLVTANPRDTLTLYSDSRCFGVGGTDMKHDLLTISARTPLKGDSPAVVASQPLIRSESAAFKLLEYVRSHARFVHRRALTFTAYVLPNANGKGTHAEAYITETSNRDFHEHPYWPSFKVGEQTPEHADIVVKQGTVEEWYLFNTSLNPHTFHIHQMAFAAEDEKPIPVMLDNVIVTSGKALANQGDPHYPLVKPGRTRIILDFRHVPRGEFVFHCHMLFHEDAGMMGIIRVI